MPHGLNLVGASVPTDLVRHAAAIVALRGTDSNLDQAVVIKRLIHGGDDVGGDAGSANGDDDFERVRAGAKPASDRRGQRWTRGSEPKR